MCTPPFSFRFFFDIDYYRILRSGLWAIQQVLIGQSFHIPQLAFANPKSPVHLPYLSPLVTISFSTLFFFFFKTSKNSLFTRNKLAWKGEGSYLYVEMVREVGARSERADSEGRGDRRA